jgi:VanZ family protein
LIPLAKGLRAVAVPSLNYWIDLSKFHAAGNFLYPYSPKDSTEESLRARRRVIIVFVDPLKFRTLWVLIGYGLVILVVFLSLSTPPSPAGIPLEDKVYHVVAYGVLMLWFSQLHPKSRYVWLACGFITLGIIMEIMQSQLDNRNGDIWDVVANSLGTILSWGLALAGMNKLIHQFENWCLKFGEEN